MFHWVKLIDWSLASWIKYSLFYWYSTSFLFFIFWELTVQQRNTCHSPLESIQSHHLATGVLRSPYCHFVTWCLFPICFTRIIWGDHGFQDQTNCYPKSLAFTCLTNVVSAKHFPRKSGKDKGEEYLILSPDELKVCTGGV